jgi:hypothetical protein
VAGVGDERDRAAGRSAIGNRGTKRPVVARLPRVVDRDDGARPRGNGGGNPGWIDQQRVGVDVDEYRRAALIHDRVRRGGKGDRRHDHLVARSDADREHGGVQRGGAAADDDRVVGVDGARERRLELGDQRPAGEPLGSQRARHRGDIVLVDVVAAVGQQLGAHRRAAVQRELGAFQFLRQGTV